MCIAMAAEGHLSALKYLHENGAKWTEDTSSYSALHGHLNCLIYAHENGCKWSSETCALAALNGHFDCLKYAHGNGCAWDTECCNNAARRGDLQMIQYLVSNGCRWSAQTTEAATIHGHLELLKYLYEHGCPSNPNTNVQLACYKGKIEILKYVHQQGCQLTPNLYESVVASNSMECLLYLRENGVAWPDVDGLRLGIQNKSHECLKYAIDNGCPHDTRTIQLAFEFGNIEVLRQLDQRDPTFNYNVLIPDLVSSAVQGGSLECLKFLIEEKRVLVRNKAGLIMTAKFRGKMDAVDYLNQLDPQFEAPSQNNIPGGFPWLPY